MKSLYQQEEKLFEEWEDEYTKDSFVKDGIASEIDFFASSKKRS